MQCSNMIGHKQWAYQRDVSVVCRSRCGWRRVPPNQLFAPDCVWQLLEEQQLGVSAKLALGRRQHTRPCTGSSERPSGPRSNSKVIASRCPRIRTGAVLGVAVFPAIAVQVRSDLVSAASKGRIHLNAGQFETSSERVVAKGPVSHA